MSGVVNRLAELGTVLAGRCPAVLTATTTFLESICDATDERAGELLDLLRRFLGWSASRSAEVDQAARAVREMAGGRTALVLRGQGSLVGVAQRLHRLTLGDRPLVVLGRDEDATTAIERAADGMLCVEARHLPRNLEPLAADVRDPQARVRLVVCAEHAEEGADLATRLPRTATVWIPQLAEREDEIDRLVEAYGRDAVAEFEAPGLGFGPHDLEWVRVGGLATLDEIEEVARRLVALRNWGVTHGAERLGITHGALSRWAQRRKIPTIGGAP